MDQSSGLPLGVRDRALFATAIVVMLLHAAMGSRYDLFRDELYFIVCGRHPAFGYADQPPLVPLMAAGFYKLGLGPLAFAFRSPWRLARWSFWQRVSRECWTQAAWPLSLPSLRFALPRCYSVWARC